MRKRIHLTFLMAALAIAGYAQRPDQLETREIALTKISETLEVSDEIGFGIAIDQWEKSGAINEELFRVKILFSLIQGTFSDSIYDENCIGFLLAFDRGESQVLTPHYYAPSFHKSDAKTRAFDLLVLKKFQKLSDEQNIAEVGKAFINHYTGKSSIWEKLENDELAGSAIQDYYNKIRQLRTYKDDVITAQTGINFTFSDQKINIAPELGLGYAWLGEKWLFRSAFGTKIQSKPTMGFRANGADVEIKNANFYFYTLGGSYQLGGLSEGAIYATADLSYRTQRVTYVAYINSMDEPEYAVTRQGTGYVAPGLSYKKEWKGSFLLIEAKYFTSLNKNLSDSRSADQLVISGVFGIRFREGVKQSHFR